MKKFAVRAMIALCVVVALCIFFSGTVRTITTPKVKLTSGKQGRFRSDVKLTGKVGFKSEKEFTLDIPEAASVKIKKLSVAAGDLVKEGGKLFTSTVVDYDASMEKLAFDYETQEASLKDVLRKTADIRLNSREKAWMDAYYAEYDASAAYRDARVEVAALMKLGGMTLPEEGYPEGADDGVKEAIDTMREAEKRYEEASALLSSLSRYAISEDNWTLLKQQNEGEKKLRELEDEMTRLSLLAKETATVRAGESMYITELSVNKGDTVNADAVVFKYASAANPPYIAADVTNVSETVSEGTAVAVQTTLYGTMQAAVTAVTVAADGTKTAYINVDSYMTDGFGGLKGMLGTDISLTLSARARENSCLLPAAAVRGSGEDRFVYVADKTSSTFGGTQIKARKQTVHVLNESADTVSVSEELSYVQIIYGEDRAISEGDTVMEAN